MDLFPTFLKLRFKLLKNNLINSFKESKFKILVITLLMVIIWFGLFFAFYKGFIIIEKNFEGTPLEVKELVEQIMRRLLSMFFFALFVMLIFSNAIIAYSGLYKTKETEYIIANPVGFEQIYLHKLIECIMFSSWAFIFFGIPLVISYGLIMEVNWLFYVGSFLLFLIFVLLPAGVGSFLTMSIVLLIPRGTYKFLKFIVFLCIAICMYIIGDYLNAQNIRGGTIELFENLLTQSNFSQSILLPSYWITEGIIGFSKNFETGLFYFLLVLSNSLFLVMITTIISGRMYRTTWELVKSYSEKKKRVGRGLYDILIPRLLFTEKNEQLRQILIKDMKTFLRDPAQWTQFFIFVGLLVIYFSNLRNLGYHEKQYMWKVVVTLLNFGATSFTMTTFTNRFIYPQFSLETGRFWLIGMAPMMRHTILLGKFIFSFIFLLLVSETLIILSCIMLEIDQDILMAQMFAILCVTLGLSGISAGLGVIYPTLKEDNPSKIIASYGGTLSLVLSLFLVTSILILLAFFSFYPFVLLGIFVISTLCFIIPMAIAAIRIERLEF